MDEYIVAVLSEATDDYTFLGRGRIEAFVYMACIETEASVEAFERTRFGIKSEPLHHRLEEMAESGAIVEDVRPTFGNELRYYYRIGGADISQVDAGICETVADLYEEYEDMPVSNLHNIVGSHDW